MRTPSGLLSRILLRISAVTSTARSGHLEVSGGTSLRDAVSVPSQRQSFGLASSGSA